MPYDCRVYRILIASPSDVVDERELAVRVIQEWNDLNSYTRKVALLPLRWETHTAPEFGTRPQEAINRAIVDECDLLVGIFWTRIGTATGIADSGTLEEIERVGAAGKPIMLYFSKVVIDPTEINTEQMEKLRAFKKNTYPNGLVENFKTQIDFKDKLTKQLEIKVRELQERDNAGAVPLTLGFIAADTGSTAQNKVTYSVDRTVVLTKGSAQEMASSALSDVIEKVTKAHLTVPLAMLINNPSSSGIRNIFINLHIRPNNKNAQVNKEFDFGFASRMRGAVLFSKLIAFDSFASNSLGYLIPKRFTTVEEKIQEFETGNVQKTEDGWTLSFEWEALQPQRARLVEPTLYVSVAESTKLDIEAKIFADSFSEPLVLKAEAFIDVKERRVALEELIPEWEKLVREASA
jgi:hypothetical protein